MNITQNNKLKLLRQFIKTYSPNDFFHRFELFKFLTLIFLLGIFTSITISAFDMHMLAHNFLLSDFITLYLGNFLPRFWLNNGLYFGLIIVVFIAFRFSWFKGFFLNRIEYIIQPKLLDPVVARHFKSVNVVLSYLLLLYMFIIAFPILHLYNLNFYAIVTAMVTLIIPFLYNNYTHLSKTKDDYKHPLSKHTFTPVSYKSASGGPLSEELKEELRRYHAIKLKAPVGTDLLTFAGESKDNKFKGFSNLFEQLQAMFNPDGGVGMRVTLHNKTADALEAALNEVLKSKYHCQGIIFSDAEFPGVKKMIRECCDTPNHTGSQKSKPQYIQIDGAERSLLDDTFNEEEYARGIFSKIKNAFTAPGPVPGSEAPVFFCLVLTHVSYLTGRVLHIESLLACLNNLLKNECNSNNAKWQIDTMPKIVYIVDGAQALGNIRIGNDVLKVCHYYGICGQKWVLGQNPLGILVHNEQLLNDNGILPWHDMTIQNSPDETFKGVPSPSDSIPFESYISTSIMLADLSHHGIDKIEEHNKYLAKSFVLGLYNLNNVFEVLNDDCSCGIVTIRVNKNKGQTAAMVNAALLDRFEIEGDLFEAEDKVEGAKGLPGKENDIVAKKGADKSDLIRFSFHYFMGNRDVNKLLYALLDVDSLEK